MNLKNQNFIEYKKNSCKLWDISLLVHHSISKIIYCIAKHSLRMSTLRIVHASAVLVPCMGREFSKLPSNGIELYIYFPSPVYTYSISFDFSIPTHNSPSFPAWRVVQKPANPRKHKLRKTTIIMKKQNKWHVLLMRMSNFGRTSTLPIPFIASRPSGRTVHSMYALQDT